MHSLLTSLRGQIALLVVLALLVAQVVSVSLLFGERGLAVQAALGYEAADRAANVVRLLERTPTSLHASILSAADSSLVRFSLDSSPLVDHDDHSGSGEAEARILALIGDVESREIRVEVHQIEAEFPPMADMPPEMVQMHQEMMGHEVSNIEMRLSITLSNSQWLNVETRFYQPPLQWQTASILSFVLTASLVLITLLWFVLTRLVGPLRRLSHAASLVGRGESVEELAVSGPSEIRELTNAFNKMQARITRFVFERTRLLAALGHDLRSPLTALRVRAEMVEDDETRDRLINSISEMQEMTDATIAFARGLADSDIATTVDVHDFLRELVESMVGASDRISLSGKQGLRMQVRPVAMRRALRNVIENAVRYGEHAHISFDYSNGVVNLNVEDDGPGISEQDFERVFEPFLRLEESRSRETGGSGLGLSIARTIIHAHGGEIALVNTQNGGLCVTISLPLERIQTTVG